MGKFDNYVLISDLDGTLLKKGNYISPKDIEAIKYFQKEGGKFTIATGRSLNRARFIKNIFTIDLPAILLNGSAIVDINKGETLWEQFIHESVLEVIRDFNKKKPQCGIIAFSKDKDYFVNPEIVTPELGDLSDFRYTEAKASDIKNPINKVVFYSFTDILEYIQKEYADYSDRLTFTKSDVNFYEIIDKTVSKGNALEKLKDIAGIKGCKIIAAGDNLNDYEMILNADIGIAAGHNCIKIREVADIIIENDDIFYNLFNELI
ncbi:MAG: Cof-type HAD-IIB family hydrolase [Ruminococcaceae bacterium]|nr:Cof-type HAD-IIB family hydrolase [Oscillospiraceae bacterium]